MHELAITQSLLYMALQEAEQSGGERITTIRLVIGRLSGVNPDVLVSCFGSLSRGTIAEGAKLEIEWVDAVAKCDRCEETWELTHQYLVCPHWSKGFGKLLSGHELRVASLAMD
ncbi:MAG: hydrogenase maturation nickel metallochaperone HypA [Dehalococcoidia bacterium]|nr:hydrogenase maturation nickel metallochaperone HypA [Dehalococcoidia bacterium]